MRHYWGAQRAYHYCYPLPSWWRGGGRRMGEEGAGRGRRRKEEEEERGRILSDQYW